MPRPLQRKPLNLPDHISGKKYRPEAPPSDHKDRKAQDTQYGPRTASRTKNDPQTPKPKLRARATVPRNIPHPTASKPQYALTQPLWIHLFGSRYNPNTTPYLIHLSYSTSTAQDSALARLSTFSESRDYAGEYLGLREIKDKGLRLCKGYEGHNMAVEKVARWLEKMWVAEVMGARGPGGRAGKWWMEFCTPEEAQLIEILEEVGIVRLGLTTKAEKFEQVEEIRRYPHRRPPTYCCSTLSPFSVKHSPSAYLISQLRSNKDHSMVQTTAHELAHFAYHSSPHYRALVDSLYKEMSDTTRTYIQSVLVEGVGYAGEVCVDEWQAYLAAEGEAYLLPDKKTGCPVVVGRAESKKEYSAAHLRGIRRDLERARASLRAEWDRVSSKAVTK